MKRAFKRKKKKSATNSTPPPKNTPNPKPPKNPQQENKQVPHTKINNHTNNKPTHFYYEKSQVKVRFQ